MRLSRHMLSICGGAAALAASLHSHSAAACGTGPLINYGGKIDAKPNVVYVYWGGGVTGYNTQNIRSTADPVLTSSSASYGLAGTRWLGQVQQYADVDMASSTNEDAQNPADILSVTEVNDAHDLPALGSTLTEQQVWTEVDYLVGAKLIPGHNADTIVVMFLPPGVGAPARACGRHLTSAGGNPYAWISYPGTEGCSDGWVQQAVAHEITESVANPQWLEGTNNGTQGWDQDTTVDCEIGDLCEGSQFYVQTQPYPSTGSKAAAEIQAQPYYSNEAVAAGSPGCVYGRSSNAFLFGLGTDSRVYAEYIQAQSLSNVSNGGWKFWGSGNGNTVQYVFKPAAASWGPNRLDAFALSNTGQMWHAWSNNAGANVSWETRDTLPGGYTFWTQYENSAPDAVSWGAGNVQVFAFDSFDQLWRDGYDAGGNWSGWQQIQVASGSEPYSKITVASAGATNTNGGFPSDVHTVNLAYIDTNNHIEFGSLTEYSTTPTWNAYASFGSEYATGIDMAIWAPGRVDVFVRDSAYDLWDCVSTDQVTIGTCYEWISPNGGSFIGSPGVVGMGDGRLLVADTLNGTGKDATFFSFWDQNGATAWNGTYDGTPNGALIGGIDAASW